jgi:hypothetical protein
LFFAKGDILVLYHKYKDLTGRIEHSISIDIYPDSCPICNKGMHPIYLAIFETKPIQENQMALDMIFKCPRLDCQTIFFGQYHQISPGSSSYQLKSTRRVSFIQNPLFPNEIINISPSFVNIYFQSFIAEANGLNEICGCGYRRALEFLIKDYLISSTANDENQIYSIKKMLLGSCIKNIDDIRIQGMAKRATWLGNDETHYYRKWEAHDLQDLKNLIEITVSWINTSLLANKYTSEMPDADEKAN